MSTIQDSVINPSIVLKDAEVQKALPALQKHVTGGSTIRSSRGSIFCALTLMFLPVLAACGDRDVPRRASWEQFKQAATRLVDGKEIYVVEWDLAVTEAELRRRYQEYTKYPKDVYGVATEERPLIVNLFGGADDVWQSGARRNLTFCVSNTFAGNYARAVTEMAQATAAWEREINVHFVYLPAHDNNCINTNPNVTFATRPWTQGGACAFFPSGGGCVNRTLVIDFNDLDTNPFYQMQAPNVRTVGVFRHELGHILGMRHEHTRPNPGVCFEDNNWRALSPYDRGSVMHYPWCNGVMASDLSITSLDALGAGLLYGKYRAPAVGDPTAYVRSDAISAVIQRSLGNIWELALLGAGWSAANLSAATGAPAAASEPAAYVREDRTNAVLFRSADNHIRELALTPSGWSAADLSAITGAPAAAGSPAAYTRSDGVSDVLFRSADNHIWELALTPSGWSAFDLSAITGAPAAASDPAGYVRADRTNAVLFRSADNHIWELALLPSSWSAADLSAITGAPAAAGSPTAYVRSDGVSDVLFRSADNHIWELALLPSGWSAFDVSAIAGAPAAASDPAPYVRGDRTNAVVFRSADNHIWELALLPSAWSAFDLSAITGAPAATNKPGAYLRSDGISAVVFLSVGNHVVELALLGTGWIASDLTVASGGP